MSVRLCELLDNTRYQVEQQAFEADELTLRFHHRMADAGAFEPLLRFTRE